MRQDESELLRLNDPSNGSPVIPISPDPRTGLVRVDMGNRAGSPDKPWIAGHRRAIVWHYLKDEGVSVITSAPLGLYLILTDIPNSGGSMFATLPSTVSGKTDAHSCGTLPPLSSASRFVAGRATEKKG